MEATFDFEAPLWEGDAHSDASWVFVTLPLEVVANDWGDPIPRPQKAAVLLLILQPLVTRLDDEHESAPN